ncbi:MAG TPA: ribonuclease HII [Acidobacteriota bacterium]|nr:ribonuclease HII [Acidobacteriota bacterium]
MVTICGIDEAGRGPVVGPLVVCGFCITPEDEKILRELGVNDSKKLSPAKREEIAGQLMTLFTHKYHLIIFWPADIDSREKRGLNLNDLEAMASAQIINHLKPDQAIIDCPSASPQNYVIGMHKWLTHKVTIRAEYKADANHLVVGAASILAKVERDRLIEELKKKIGIDFGSGYTSDPKTQEFLAANWNKFPVFRTTWDTYKQIVAKNNQKNIFDF